MTCSRDAINFSTRAFVGRLLRFGPVAFPGDRQAYGRLVQPIPIGLRIRCCEAAERPG